MPAAAAAIACMLKVCLLLLYNPSGWHHKKLTVLPHGPARCVAINTDGAMKYFVNTSYSTLSWSYDGPCRGLLVKNSEHSHFPAGLQAMCGHHGCCFQA